MPNTAPERRLIHVAAGVITDPAGRVFIAERPAESHQGGLWEFPGGKVESGETARCALRRELAEELGIRVTQSQPLIRVPYHYPDKSVLLDVWQVTGFEGEPWGKEGQQTRWVSPQALKEYAFPAANHPIVNAVVLPALAAVTGSHASNDDFMQRFQRCISTGAGLIYLRESTKPFDEQLIKQAARVARSAGCTVVTNNPAWCKAHNWGLHLKSSQLERFSASELQEFSLVGASCHSEAELNTGKALNIDYAFLSPVCNTWTHPEADPLGFSQFARMLMRAGLPVYGLGGLAPGDVPLVRMMGGHGVAALSTLWS